MNIDTAALALGTNAVTAFMAALAFLLALTSGLWWTCRAIADRRRGQGAAPRGVWPLVLAPALVAVLAGLVFTEMTGALQGAQAAMGRFDSAVIAHLHIQLPPAARQVFTQLTRLGDGRTLTALCLVGALWLLHRRENLLAGGWVVAIAGNAVLNKSLKSVFERVRPEQAVLYEGDAAGFSFPSGHSSGAVVAYGMLAYLALRLAPARWQLPVLLATAATVFTVGCSRVLLQVHYPSDVMAGFASGSLWLTLCIVGVEAANRREPAAA